MRLATPRIASLATPTYSGRLGMISSTSASGLGLGTGAGSPGSELLHRFRFGAIDLEDFGQPGDLEDAQDARVVAEELQVALPLAGPLQAANEHPEAGAVQVFYSGQIDEQLRGPAVEKIDDLLLHPR